MNNVVFIWSHVQSNLAHSSSGWMIASPRTSQKWTEKQTPELSICSCEPSWFFGELGVIVNYELIFLRNFMGPFFFKIMLNLLG
jgi:hypothetical protein